METVNDIQKTLRITHREYQKNGDRYQTFERLTSRKKKIRK